MKRQTLFKILEKLLIVLMSLLVINVLWQVFSRYALGAPSRYTDEIARFMMIWIGLLGTAYVSGEQGHIAIDLFLRGRSSAVQQKLRYLISFLIIAFALVVLIIGGVWLVYTRYILGVTSAALKIPMAYVYLALPLSGLIIIYFEMTRFFPKNKAS